MSASLALSGYLPRDHVLSPQARYPDMKLLGRWLASYPDCDLWELDSQRLPAPLRRARRRFRDFAERELKCRAQRMDQAPHAEAGSVTDDGHELLIKAGVQGMLTQALPWPWGSARPLEFMYPMAWKFTLMTEEFAAVDGGLMLFLCAHYLGLMPLMLSGNIGQIRRFVVPDFKSTRNGDPSLYAYAITEPGAGSDVEEGHGAQSCHPRVIARRVESGWSLSGRKCFISGGDIAKRILVFAALEGEGMESWTCFLVERDTPGFRVARTELKMGMRASGAAELEFDNAFIPDDHVIGGLREGWTLNRATLNLSRFPVAAMGIGFARGACEAALRFCCQTTLGGRHLIDFQEVQMQLADMVAAIRSMRSGLWQVASHSRQPRQLEASLCKFHFTDQSQQVCEQALELIGNHNGADAYYVEKALRDVRLTRIFEGTNQINRLALIEDWQPQLLRQINEHTTSGV